MNPHYSTILLIILFLSLGTNSLSQYCLTVGPSSNDDSNLQSAFLSGDSGTEINFNGCPGIIGLNDQTSIYSVNLSPGDTYSIDVEFGSCGGNYPGVGEVWIDFNQDFTFDATESIGTWSGTPPTSISTFTFTVPSIIQSGQSRMRIVHQESASLPLDPCASFTWGSTTDFNINFGPGIDCSGYIGNDMSSSRIVNTLPFQESHNNSICYSNNVTVYNSPDVFYRLIPANYSTDFFNVSLCGSTFDTYLQILDSDTNVVAYNDDYGPCAPHSEVSFSSIGHDTLYVIVQGWSNEKGDYTIEINDGNTVSFDELIFNLDIYPNPSSGIFYIKGIDLFTQISITDINGKLIYEESTSEDIKFNLESFDKGVYFIHFYSDKYKDTQKIIIK